MDELCPCGKILKYELCCQVIHNDISKALTSEQLMRSRYTAFTKGMGLFIIKSSFIDETSRKNR